ncbi:metallophosphoesterase family protein [Corynebacterium aquilae]|uniref:Serine/threonine protein phosphatase n=1 Tax=Corynebacterium aquilae DSM 44791 TaxID=1431546 RepID=A0A1L7CGS0_9CORY|nr:metallophosphoesterase [Corynebacterium aquilae]APT84953.1 serine/threonine protein phosphatase [Corynebacterium aquilae DSM 44791]
MARTLWAVADLHAAVAKNEGLIDSITPHDPGDWLIVAGDVAERTEKVLEVLENLNDRFAKVIWVPGNHELFCRSSDRYTGRAKYDELVRGCRNLGILTPEDPYPVFDGVTIVPLFTLYDYSFRRPGFTVEQAVQAAHDQQVVMTDQFAIAPFVDIRAWCWDRLAYSIKRLSKVQGPTILVNHWPLAIEPVLRMRFRELSLWCGTRHTRDWPTRYNAQQVVYGHLHIRGDMTIDGIPHREVSLGYPREWENAKDIAWPVAILGQEATA